MTKHHLTFLAGNHEPTTTPRSTQHAVEMITKGPKTGGRGGGGGGQSSKADSGFGVEQQQQFQQQQQRTNKPLPSFQK